MGFYRIAAVLVFGALLIGSVADVSTAAVIPVSGSTTDPIAYVGNGSAVGNVIDGILDFDSFLALGFEGFGNLGGPYTVRFDLGAAYDLTGFNLWNNAGFIDLDDEGVNAFTLGFLDPSQTAVGSYGGNAADILAQQTFDLSSSSSSGVRFVDFTIISSHYVNQQLPDRQYVAFHEVSFEGTQAEIIPEPATILIWSLLGIIGITAGWCRRRRQAA